MAITQMRFSAGRGPVHQRRPPGFFLRAIALSFHCKRTAVPLGSLDVCDIKRGNGMIPHIPENWLVDWNLGTAGITMPPRDPKEDDDEDDEEDEDDDEDDQPAVIREPDEDE
jgi:hypothetical protein